MINKVFAMTLAAMTALAPITANALSCGPKSNNIGHRFNSLITRGGEPVVMVASPIKLMGDAGLPTWKELRKPGRNRPPVAYTLSGTILSADGWEKPSKIIAEITARCSANWCGRLPRDRVARLFLLSKSETGYAVSTHPCGGEIYNLPSKAQLAALKRCIKNGRCSDEDLKKLRVDRRFPKHPKR